MRDWNTHRIPLVWLQGGTITEIIDKRKLLIFCAVKFEARTIKQALAAVPHDLFVIGVAAVRLPREIPQDAAICMAGLAGALDPTLAIGDVVVDELSDLPSLQLPFRRVRMHTAGQIVGTPAERAALFSQTSALVVEMENEKVRAFARERGVPYVGIRAISDRASDTLKPAVARIVDPFGRPRLSALAKELLRRPALALELNRLRRNSALAMSNLGEALRALAAALG